MKNRRRRHLVSQPEQFRHYGPAFPGNQRNDRTHLEWTEETKRAFDECKRQLANGTLLSHPAKSAEMTLWVDASDFAAGAALHQIVDNQLQPLGYFSKKLTSTQTRYSTYDRELTAIYMTVKHFQYLLEGRTFHVITNYKPLVYALYQNPEKVSPPE